MTRFLFAALLVSALALPATARAQTETLLDDAQRAAIQDYFKKEAEKAAAAAQARKAKQTGKGDAKAQAKGKKTEKPKKPEKPKTAQKDKSKTKAKDKAKDKTKANAKNGDKPKPAAAARTKLERGQVLAQDLPRRALPKDLDAQLGKPARGTQRVIVGDDIVLFERKTGRILDVVEGAVKNGGRGR